MNVEFAKIDDVNGVITVSIQENDYEATVQKELKNVARLRPEPGFRPGKTPIAIIKKKYGDSVKYEVINRTVGDALFEYIKEQKLHVLGNPMPVKDNEIKIEDKDYTLRFNVGLAPEFDLKLDKETKIPYYTIKVTDDMVEKQDMQIRRRFGSQESGEEIDETAVVRGVITELDSEGNIKEDGILVENGILSPEHFVDDDQKALFIGKKKEDEIHFNPAKASGSNAVEMGSMLHLPKEEATAHDGDFRFKVTDIVSLKLAEENQDLYDRVFGKDQVHNHEEYIDALRKMVASQLEHDSDFRFTLDAKKALLDNVGEVPLPDDILKNFLVQSEDSNLNESNIDEEYLRMRPELLWELVREAAAEKLDIKIDAEDMTKIARQAAISQFAQYGILNPDPETVDNFAQEILKDKKAQQQIATQALNSKIYNGIRASVTIEPKEVSVEEFNELFK